MPSKNPTIQKAYKDGVISKGQYDKLSDGLLLGIIKKKRATKGSSTGGKSKGKVQPKGRGSSTGESKGKTSKRQGDHTKEKRHKLGKEAHKRGRPKGGSKVEIVS